MLIVKDDGYGITVDSLATWRDNRELFGRFIEARVYWRSDGALIDGRFCLWGGDELHPAPPSMVLIDDRGNELWLSGMTCSYSGEGPAGAETVLRGEQFGDAANAVFKYVARVILRKDQDGKVTSELIERDQTLWDGESEITWWLREQAKRPAGADRDREIDRLR
jgi:hypothetical protein